MRRWRLALALACCVAGGDARAQASGSMSVVSDYYYRGVGYSKGDPVPQFNLSFDTRSGWYAGTFASMLKMSGTSRGLYAIGYAGYARRMAAGGSWEAGGTNHTFSTMSALNYREVYVGLGSDRLSGRVSYSPAYMGTAMRTVYSEVNGGLALNDDVGLFARIGYLRAVSAVPRYTSGPRLDGRIGIGVSIEAWKLQAAWDALHAEQGTYARTGGSIRSRNGLVLSVTRSF
ncbi:TorF family putative porin [Massilia pseudoviolaceinigra]|uniref:TorF family putative porin n=1 Tax=Massilia pseudoviolaceinigra TaxID=3057165 RepID=UPI00279671DC|nr:TorF family putative porin [Massilia sp. CCM 9206]MDQ1919396.1 TorF family putative porin [Massilia sp. CCM 9206]